MAKKFTREETIEKFRQVWGDQYDYSLITDDNYVNTSTRVPIVCRRHGMWMQTPHDHLQGNGCPFCKESKLEKSVALFLDNNNIEYKRWYRYDVNEHRTSLDFFIKKYNIAIECQGEQHFQPVKFKGEIYDEWAEKEFKKNLIRDKKKFEKCNELNIKLYYYIPNNSSVYINNVDYNNIYTKDNVISNIEDILKHCK